MNESREDGAARLLQKTTAFICGFGGGESLSGVPVEQYTNDPVCGSAAAVLKAVASGREVKELGEVSPGLLELVERGISAFYDYYTAAGQEKKTRELLELLESGVDGGLLAEEITKTWAPELQMDDEEILRRWQLQDLGPAQRQIKPEEVLLQLNALYTLPETIPTQLDKDLAEEGSRITQDPGRKVADYDHPVPLFAPDKDHELIGCMDELNRDVAFEKEQGVLPEGHRVPVLISVSVTHEKLDRPAGEWIRRHLANRKYDHLRVLVLTEETADRLARSAVGTTEGVFSVFGAYGRHFTALKYAQLLLEPVLGVTAGFKLDTDEGIRSRELWEATGKSWFETLCHPYWGGSAKDWKGRTVYLGVNEGEYVNSGDIERLGYQGALRAPDVSIPDSWAGPSMFFHKGFAHGRATALYNRFHRVEEGVSHPVVKGGGYGITNETLRRAVPFTFSKVGRAEDQQFYFSCLAAGIRGIFQPDLRIAHYKSAVGKAEDKTEASRFLGDLYRLVIFEHLVELYGVKEDLDPMPGIFAGPLARAQAAFSLLLKAVVFRHQGKDQAARYLLDEGADTLASLERQIDEGTIEREHERERLSWSRFISKASSVSPDEVAAAFGIE